MLRDLRAKTLKDNPFTKLLASHPVTEIPKVRDEIVVIDGETSPVDAFKRLVKENIVSAPVFDQKTKTYTGFIDMRSLLNFVSFMIDQKEGEKKIKEIRSKGREVFLQAAMTSAATLYDTPIKGITCKYLSRLHKFFPVKETKPISDVVRILKKTGVHRVPILNENGCITNIISQSTIIHFLHKHKDEIGNALNVKIAEIPRLRHKPIVLIKDTDSAQHCFKIMQKHNLSGVAIVNSKGHYVENTSASDLKHWLRELEKSPLDRPIIDWLKAIRSEQKKIERKQEDFLYGITLKDVMDTLAHTGWHRVFLIKNLENPKPTAVVSVSDILMYITEAEDDDEVET